jgi:methylmalonyl-CoA mutase cobalamin-binding subunit
MDKEKIKAMEKVKEIIEATTKLSKMTIYEYVALNNPNGAKTVLKSFGVKAVLRPDILAKQLANSVINHGKKSLYRIAAIHPDFELVSEYYKQIDPTKK